jgi:branched-chain amino acid transport system substrate-binding protein
MSAMVLSVALAGFSPTVVSASVKKTTALPAEVTLCGIFPISQRPDAGPDRRDGFLIAVDEINAQTGTDRILPEGVTLKGIYKDDLNSAEGGTSAANSCLDDGADIVIGSSGSTVSAAIAAVLTPEKIIQISYASTSPSLSDRTLYPYFMRDVPSDADQGIAIADLVATFGWTKGATINTDDSYGTGLVSHFKAAFENASADNKLVSEQTFTPQATEIGAQVQAIKDQAPQFVLVHAIDNDAKTFYKKAKELGFAGGDSKTVFLVTDGSSTTATFAGDADVKDAMQHVIGTTPAALTQSKYDDFNTTWFDVTSCGDINPCGGARTSATPNSYAPFAYDAVYAAAMGLADANTLDTDTLLASLYDVSFTGAGGVIKFNNLGETNGRFDYVTLVGDSYTSFGQWSGSPTYSVSSIDLAGNQTWSISGTTATCESGCVSASSIPGFESFIFFAAIIPIVLIKRRKK